MARKGSVKLPEIYNIDDSRWGWVKLLDLTPRLGSAPLIVWVNFFHCQKKDRTGIASLSTREKWTVNFGLTIVPDGTKEGAALALATQTPTALGSVGNCFMAMREGDFLVSAGWARDALILRASGVRYVTERYEYLKKIPDNTVKTNK